MACVTLNRDLHIGSQGDDVKGLQDMLGQDPDSGFTGTSTGFFGSLTAQAMMHFQMHNGIASSTDGHVGPLTRGFFERRCGMGMDGSQGTNEHVNGSTTPPMPGNEEGRGGQNTSGGWGQGEMHNGSVSGHITAVSGGNVTIQDASGASHTVVIGTNTTIMMWNGTSTPPTLSNAGSIAVGAVMVAEGTTNSDGSLQAIHIRVGFAPPPQLGGGDNHWMPTNGGQPPVGPGGHLSTDPMGDH
jgi:peptidoglycan hydrolase-like protein with peptidoglycan-binding domain